MLTVPMRRQVDRQIDAHYHGRYAFSLGVPDTQYTEPDLVVYPGVYRSDVMITRDLASYFFENPRHFLTRRVLDMGCGTGHIGILLALLGAWEVVLTDVCPTAVANAQENVSRFRLDGTCKVERGDLFDAVSGQFGLIVFNHPFFPAPPDPAIPITRSMLDEGALLSRFLYQARQYCLTPGGRIIMPYLKLAGDTNDPSVQGPHYGYSVTCLASFSARLGIQVGPSAFYELAPHAQSLLDSDPSQ